MRFTAIVATLLLFLLTAWSLPVAAAPKKHVIKKTVVTKKVAIAKARERTEFLLPRVTVSADGTMLPDLRAAAAIVYNPDTNEILYESNAQESRPIASITKVMTAATFMETEPDLTQVVTVTATDTKLASHTYLHAGDRLTVDDLMHLLLIASDNAAARVLARVSPYGTLGFIDRMNEKAVEFNLPNTMYADSSGLLKANVSTALDMAKLIAIVSSNTYISGIMQTANYAFRTVQKRLVAFHTTDHLLMHNVPVMAAKTGFTNPAGFCLASLLRMPTLQNIAIVVLGARTNAERFIEVENLFQWWMLHEKMSSLRVQDVIPAVHLSAQGIDFIKRVEGFHAKPYKDSGGYAVGYGFHHWNGRKVTKTYPRFVTAEEADAQFEDQLATYEDVVADSIAQPLSQPAYDSLVSIAYNLGRINTHIIEKLSAGRAVTPADFLATATVRNRPNAGLETRRLREFVMFAGDYQGVMLSSK